MAVWDVAHAALVHQVLQTRADERAELVEAAGVWVLLVHSILYSRH